MSSATVIVPVHTVNPLNGSHGHWWTRNRRNQDHKVSTWAAVRECAHVPLPIVVTLTRHSAGTLDDDNLRGALKAVRDGVALVYRIDDADPRIEWRYDQAKCRRGEHFVSITIEGKQ